MKRHRRKFSFLLSLLLAVSTVFTGVSLEKTVLAADESKEDWTAQWIWDSKMPGTLPEAGDVWMNFRKTVDLKEVPDKVTAKIAAESRYWLYVNGEMVVFEGGLKRGPNRNDGYYDVVDLASYLKEGENVIAATVWYWGEGRTKFFQQPGRCRRILV